MTEREAPLACVEDHAEDEAVTEAIPQSNEVSEILCAHQASRFHFHPRDPTVVRFEYEVDLGTIAISEVEQVGPAL